LDSRHSSVAPSFYEEAITPESAKDSARYPAGYSRLDLQGGD
jgi:hypothetical protein